MLYYLHYLSGYFGGFNVFRYITFRAAAATLTALIFTWIIAPALIRALTRLKMGQPLRGKEEVRDLAALHQGKKGTPTMGGLLIIFSVAVSSLLWVDFKAANLVWLALGAMVFLGGVGFLDDYLKVSKKKSAGLPGRLKIVAQVGTALVVGGVLLSDPLYADRIARVDIPFTRGLTFLHLGFWAALFFFSLVVTGSSNAVNLTDGLDGLATGCTLTVALVFAVFAYIAGNLDLAQYLFVSHIRNAGSFPSSARRSSGRASASCGSTATPPASSWGIPAPWPSAGPSASSPSAWRRNSSWSSPGGSSSSRRSPSSSRSLPSS